MKKIQQVVKAKLTVTPNVADELKITMREFAKACNLISQVAHEQGLHRRYDIHHATYHEIRKQTALSSQHVVNVIAQVAEAYTRDRKKRHAFKRSSSVRYDSRTMSFKRDFHEATLTVCPKGRVSGELQMSTAMRARLRAWTVGGATLIFRKGQFYLHITISAEIPNTQSPIGSLGIDLGVKRLAVTSDNTFHTARFVRHKKRQFQQTRSSLQANGSPRAKRVLRQVSGREARFINDVNHCISKQIVQRAKASNLRIVLEELTGIVARADRWMFKHLHGWSFADLRAKIEYKALAVGVECVTVNPCCTSIGCSNCLHIGSRPNQSTFTCGHCGMRLNADLNAARGIAKRHDLLAMGRYFCNLEVSQPTLKSQALA